MYKFKKKSKACFKLENDWEKPEYSREVRYYTELHKEKQNINIGKTRENALEEVNEKKGETTHQYEKIGTKRYENPVCPLWIFRSVSAKLSRCANIFNVSVKLSSNRAASRILQASRSLSCSRLYAIGGVDASCMMKVQDARRL